MKMAIRPFRKSFSVMESNVHGNSKKAAATNRLMKQQTGIFLCFRWAYAHPRSGVDQNRHGYAGAGNVEANG
jgi:hypothetical protein